MKKCTFLVLFVSAFLIAKSQAVDSMINVYAEELPNQKVHVHFDKDLYRAGETIWFKAYLFSGTMPDLNSKNFYAELINSSGEILQRNIYPIAESVSFGSFTLPDSFPPGSLIFRGYTTWQLNFDTSFLFQKNIAIVDKDGKPEMKKTEMPKTSLLQFFPEGGDLVNTLQSRIAFKANDNYGLPVFVKGNILNSKNETVASFIALHDGMGAFNLTPQPGETYKAVWKDASGKEQTTFLPEAKADGYVLSITSAGNKKIFKITRTDNVPDDLKQVNIIALFAQQRVYKAKADLINIKTTGGAIPVESLPSGVLQVTVFSENWQPLAERIVMINNDNYRFNAKVSTPVLNTNFRAKNTFEVEVEDTGLSNMSLAITDAAVGKQSFGDNIISRMLLTGDIKGYVHNPAYYFSNNSDSIASHLDLVMLTHGWRRYNWEMLVKGKKPALKFAPDAYLSLNAKVFGVTSYSPLRNDEELLVFINGKDSSRQFVQLKKTGSDKFSLPNLVFYDTATLFYQFAKDKDAEKQMSLAFSTNFYKGLKNIDLVYLPVALQIDSTIFKRTKFFAEKQSRYGSPFNTGAMLGEVIVKTKVKSRIQELDSKYASGLFKTGDATFFDFTDDKAIPLTDIFSYLQGRVAGLQVNGRGSNAQLKWRGSTTSLYLNEMPSDAQMVSTISPADIAYVKVFRPPFMSGFSGGAGGAVAIYTRKGNDTKPLPGAGLNKTKVTGYTYPKQFYSPNYSDLAVSADAQADFRTTIYWNPVLLADGANRKVKVEFYNNDITKAFRIVLEGMNDAGKLVRIEKVVQ